MKRIKRFLLWIFLAIVAYMGYIYFFAADNATDAINLVPKNAVYIIQTKKPIKAWKKFSSSDLWMHLKNYPEFKEIAESANGLDQMISANKTLFSIFSLDNLIISAHVTKPTEYEFLFLTDLSKASKSGIVKDNLGKLFALADYKVSKQDYKGIEINVCKDLSDKSTLYVSAIANYLACSYDLQILKNSIEEYYEPTYKNDKNFMFIEDKMATGGLAQIYLNYDNLVPFLQVYMGEVDKGLTDIVSQMHFSGLNGELEDSYMKLQGNTNINDSVPEILTVLSKSGNSKLGVHKVLSERTALLLRLGFNDFNTFFQNSLSLSTDKAIKKTNRNLKLIELVMGISIQEDFLSWIGDEIAVAQYYNETLVGNKVPKIIALKVNSKRDAKDKLDKVFKKMQRRLPFKFEEYEFKGHEIRYMETKGLFNLLFGKIFDRVDKPFFCFLDDYVIFCDDPRIILQTIVDYEANKTLSDEANFKFVNKDLSNSSSFFTYISPKLYFNNFSALLKYSSFAELKKNKQYITCFNGTGFLLKAEGEGVFKTEMGSSFLKESIEIIPVEDLEEEELEELDEIDRFIIEHLNGLSIKKQYPSGKLMSIQSVNNAMTPDGNYTEYWESEEVKTKGRYQAGKKIGTWRYYNEDGQLIEKIKIR